MFELIDSKLIKLLETLGLAEAYQFLVLAGIKVFASILISYIAFIVSRKYIVSILSKLAKKTKSNWDDVLIERKVFNRLAYLVPSYILYWMIPLALEQYPEISTLIVLGIRVYSIVIVMLVGTAFLDSIMHIYHHYDISKAKPIKGYIQVGKILIYILSSLTLISILIGQSPMLLIGGLGAFSAVLLLVFKDSILGLVAGVQLTANDMLRPGDWISMPKYDADGTVTDITLTTIKIQNWDKTISTIPAYSLFTDSFKNWRGMEESGGRRIKRSVNIDMTSIRFCTEPMLEKYKQFQYIVDYVENKEVEIQQYNSENKINTKVLVNGRRQTNIGVFRAYLNAYLQNHPDIRSDMTFLIRQLQSGEHGLPVEIYVFSKVQAWAQYESIQADIFDHILAVIPEFDLRVFQNPSGSDFRSLTETSLPPSKN
ncbi:MAG: mechanosensitive ion channel family protein [Bacteroidales bacterium]|nr:mechanosensitive ion channel family protein [Bacteroidales bacterium]